MSVHRFFYISLYLSLYVTLALGLACALVFAMVKWYLMPQLPSMEVLKEISQQLPLRVYTKEGKLIGEFGDERRLPLTIDKIPPQMVNAILAAEDDRFLEHPGVDFKGLARAAFALLKTGEIQQGGSTITMQVARNFFLTRERTFSRKVKEILLALKIESELSKDKIMELYLNKVFFGHQAYGVGAAAQIYYGKTLQELALPEYAMLAGLPQAPSIKNPLSNEQRALERRDYILKRMYELNYINQTDYETAVNTTNTAKLHKTTLEAESPYIAEMVRAYMVERFGDDAYTVGYKVFTTIDATLQKAAQIALRNTLFHYDERHYSDRQSYRGKLDHVELPSNVANIEDLASTILHDYPVYGGLLPSLVLKVTDRTIVAYNRRVGQFEISGNDLTWARRYLSERRRGDVILVRAIRNPSTPQNPIYKTDKNVTSHKGASAATKTAEANSSPTRRWRLAQIPQVQGALVSLRPDDGAIVTLVGGFDFRQSKFNRVTQAQRQPGSSFKPFIYSAALAHGYSPNSVVVDAPLSFKVGHKVWRPQNFGGRFYGPTTLRKALTLSRNLVSIRLLMFVGVEPTINHIVKFGFHCDEIPKNLTIALGTADVTPLEMVRGFAVFANGGYRIDPYFVERIEDGGGKVVFTANPLKVCRTCPPRFVEERCSEKVAGTDSDSEKKLAGTPLKIGTDYAPLAIEPRNAWLMTDIMKDVIRKGTAKLALKLNREDIAGKTGTTNEERDAWFSGYNPEIVTTTWIGFDQPRPLGKNETGGHAALPMWVEFMGTALKDKPINTVPMPTGLTTARVDPNSGTLTSAKNPIAKFETFFSETAPKRRERPRAEVAPPSTRPKFDAPSRDNRESPRVPKRPSSDNSVIPEQLF
ncbi:MAG: hypothetical protein BWK79_02520 [Beggiatoa sp. IS2]|nr:MAG: hypothetical protein BWK79_02520 [Beggiatoa sp. IS2]